MQTFALLLAGAGLWMLCRRLRATAPPLLFRIIAGGFVLRAAAACALFWISWLGLPVGKSLQLGRGFWFFAGDAVWYFDIARGVAEVGLRAIPLVDPFAPSPFFLQVLALFIWAFGAVPSVAILLNAVCYLLTAAIVVHLSRRDERLATPAAAALLFLAFSPGCVLWSLQPLKDTLFSLLLALFVLACVAWQDAWIDPARRRVWPRALALAVALIALVYAITSIRWYVAFALWLTLPLLAAALAFVARRRAAAFAATIVLMALCSQAIVVAGVGAAMPRQIRAILQPHSGMLPRHILGWIESVRSGSDHSPGATTIAAGRVVDEAAVGKLPDTRGERIAAGAAAMFVPRMLAQPLGLVVIEGGRGFWFVADADTLALDALLIFAVVFCARELRRRRVAAPAWIVVLASAIAIAVPVIYTMSNFGTLFRLRQIIATELCLLPLVLPLKR